MRTDVKLGIVVAMVVVSVAGGYYMYRDRVQQPILLGGQGERAAAQARTSPVSQSPRTTSPSGRSRGTLAQGTKHAPQRLTQPGAAGKTGRVAGQKNAARSGGAAKAARLNANRKSAHRNNVAKKPASRKNAADQKLAQRAPRGGNRRDRGSASPRAGATHAQRSVGRANPIRGKSGREQVARSVLKLPPVASRGAKSPGSTLRSASKPLALTAVAPSSIAVEKHRVQPGDSLSSLAVQYYGSEKHTRLLIDANKQLADPNRLKIGEIVNLPPMPKADGSPKAARSAHQTRGKVASGTRTYTVRSGDSFYRIAKSQLGDASRWKELYELNRSVVGSEPTALRVGQVLVLPQ